MRDLPEPTGLYSSDGEGPVFAYTAEQMREYARVALPHPPEGAQPRATPTDGEFWSFLRRVMSQAVSIRMDYDLGRYKDAGYEAYSARLDAAASERAEQWLAAHPPEGAQPEPDLRKALQAIIDHPPGSAHRIARQALERAAEGAQTLPAAAEEDAVHGRCAGWLRLFTFKHGRDPFPQEVWDAALVLGYQTAAALPTPPNAQETKT